MSWIMVGAAAVSTTVGIAKGAKKKKLGNEQFGRSQELRDEAGRVKKPALRQEFKDTDRMMALRTLMGLPALNQQNETIDLDETTALRAGQEGSSSSADYLTYASAINEQGNRAKRDLKVQDAGFRDKAFTDYANTKWQIGNEELKNVAIQREERNKILGQSAALENAGTANKYAGTDEIIGAVGSGITSGLGAYAASKTDGGTTNSMTSESYSIPTSQVDLKSIEQEVLSPLFQEEDSEFVMQFQKKHGLPVTGKKDRTVINFLKQVKMALSGGSPGSPPPSYPAAFPKYE